MITEWITPRGPDVFCCSLKHDGPLNWCPIHSFEVCRNRLRSDADAHRLKLWSGEWACLYIIEASAGWVASRINLIAVSHGQANEGVLNLATYLKPGCIS
eukprot:scaffold14918_cov20-Tisochrysis_lutea.AAC.1